MERLVTTIDPREDVAQTQELIPIWTTWLSIVYELLFAEYQLSLERYAGIQGRRWAGWVTGSVSRSRRVCGETKAERHENSFQKVNGGKEGGPGC
jgi:hypothetical protein